MTLPSPCLTDGVTHCSSIFSFVLRLTNILLFDPKTSNLDSSAHNTFFQSFTVQYLCSFANLNLFFLLISLRYCQSCVPHVTCFPLLSCPYLVSSCSCPRLSPLVSTCVLIAPHLFQFSSFDFLVFKSPVSPVSCVRDYMSPCVLLKSMFENSPGLLAPCSPLRECDRITDLKKKKRRISSLGFVFPFFEKFFISCFFPCSRGDGSRRPLRRPCPPRSPFPRVFAGVLQACRGDGIR